MPKADQERVPYMELEGLQLAYWAAKAWVVTTVAAAVVIFSVMAVSSMVIGKWDLFMEFAPTAARYSAGFGLLLVSFLLFIRVMYRRGSEEDRKAMAARESNEVKNTQKTT